MHEYSNESVGLTQKQLQELMERGRAVHVEPGRMFVISSEAHQQIADKFADLKTRADVVAEIRAMRELPLPIKKALKKRQAADYLSISIKRLFKLRDSGEIEVIRHGKTGAQLFPIASLDAWLAENAERF